MITLVLSTIHTHTHTHTHAGIGREMIVVVDDITGPAPCVGDDALSEREAADLNRGRAFIRHYLESGSSVIEVSVETAVQAVAKVREGDSEGGREREALSQRLYIKFFNNLF